MIGKLKGYIEDAADDSIILDVNGVGYVIYLTTKTLSSIAHDGTLATFYIETQVREDAIRLYGFRTRLEQEWFKLLLNVQGVGAKVAMALLGTLSPAELAQALALRDIAMVSRAPGIGKKVAERIVTELKNKAPHLMPVSESTPHFEDITNPIADEPVNDALSALVNLGYSRDQAAVAITKALKRVENSADSAQLIRLGLKELSR